MVLGMYRRRFPATRTTLGPTPVGSPARVRATCNALGGSSKREQVRKTCVFTIRVAPSPHALALGESSPVTGKLLGHVQVQATARQARPARYSVQTAAAHVASGTGGIRPSLGRPDREAADA